MQRLANAVIVQWGWRRFAVAFVAGALSALAFAPFNLFPILWLTVPVFVWLIDGAESGEGAAWWRRLLPAASVGFAFGFGFFTAGLWWIATALLVDGDQFAWAVPLAAVALPAALALFWAFGAALARLFWTENWSRIVVFAVAMTIAEWLRGHILTGFPWNAFGYALTPFPLMMQSAAIVGIWGLTLAAFLVFAAPALVADVDRSRGVWALLGVALGLLIVHVGYGAIALRGGEDATVEGVRFRIIQPLIPQSEAWAQEGGAETLQRYIDLSNSDGGLAGITHLVWPESAFPFLLTDRPDALSAIADLLPPGVTLMTGAARAERNGETPTPVFNSVYVIDDGGEIVGAYDKVHLVPFGEYLPWRGLLEWFGLRQVIALPGGFSPGDRRRTLTVPNAPPMGPLICYEVVFPDAVIDPDQRPSWLLNLTNDGWYGGTPGPYQHFQQARVRAVEEGLPLVRGANTGISAIVDGHGRIVASLDLERAGVVDGNLPQALPETPYGRFGDLIFWGLVVAGCAIAAAGRPRKWI